MLRTYTESEMLIYWKRRLGLKASAAVVGEEDMTELDRKLLADIDSWYDDLLANAPVERLPVEDMKDEVSCRYISDNAAQIDLPERGVRLVSVRMHEWACDEVECYSAYSAVARLQRNRLTRASVDEPVVLRRPGRIEVHGLEPPSSQASADADSGVAMPPSTAVPKIDSLEMVVRPPKGTYILDTAAAVAAADTLTFATSEKEYITMEKNKKLLAECRRHWDGMASFRSRRRLCMDYAYGRQWGQELVLYNGRVVTEGQYLTEQGNVPITNNLTRQLIKTVVGKWRYLCSMRDTGEGGEEASFRRALAASSPGGMNDARALEEFLISGFVAQRVSPKGVVNISPSRVFLSHCEREDISDCRMLGVLHDMPVTEMLRRFSRGGNRRFAQLAALAHRLASREDTPLFAERSDVQFDVAAGGKVRVIEVWRRTPRSLLRIHDLENGTYVAAGGDDGTRGRIRDLNIRRAAEGREALLCLPDVADVWQHSWLTAEGDMLASEVLPEGARPSLAVRCYPMIDGEIHSLVEDVMSQQYYVNRLISLLDEVLRFSAKGVLLFPTDQLPTGMDWKEMRQLWGKPGSIIPFVRNSKNITPVQIDSGGTSAGASEMLKMQLDLFGKISGTAFAGDSKGVTANSADMLRRQMENEMVSLLDILASFQAFIGYRDSLRGDGKGVCDAAQQ